MSVFHPKHSAHKGLKSLSSSSHSILNRLPSNGIPCFMCSDLSQRTPGKLSCLCAASDELCIHENIGNSGTPDHGGPSWCRDHIVHAPSQWEATLQCNVVSHWLGACTGWSLLMDERLGKDRMARALQQLWKPWLTHWFLEGVVVLSNDFLTPMKDRYLEHFLLNFTQVNDTKAHWWLVNIGSGNSLVSPGLGRVPNLRVQVRVLVICVSPSTWLLHEYEYQYEYWLMSTSTSTNTSLWSTFYINSNIAFFRFL